jgi:TRAP-type C4-dicarboxylate transport system substrate-binding protein
MLTRRATLIALATAATSVAQAQATTRLRVSTASPPSDFLARALDAMKVELDGAKLGLATEIYPAGALFKQGTEVPALQRGTLEMSTMTTFEVAQQMPEYGFFNRGYLFRDYDHLRHVFDGPIGEAYRKAVSARMEIRSWRSPISERARSTCASAGRSRVRPISRASRCACRGGPEWLLLGRALGVGAVPLGAPEVYLALKTGTIDGQENPLSIFNATKLYEVTEQVVQTAHMIQPVFINISTAAWNRLNPAQQDGLRSAAKRAGTLNDTLRMDDEKTVTAGLVARGLTVDIPDIAAFRANADKVYAESDMVRPWNADLLKQVQAVS